MAKGKAMIPIYVGQSELDLAFLKVQEAFRADSRLGPFSTFVKQAAVVAWENRRQGDGKKDQIEITVPFHYEDLRRRLEALEAKINARPAAGDSAAAQAVQDDEEARKAIEDLARNFGP